MKTARSLHLSLAGLLLLPVPALAQTVAPAGLSSWPLRLQDPAEPLRNRVSVSFRPGFNLKAGFKHLGGLAPQTDPGPSTGGDRDRRYDDGYNLRDLSPSDGLTWNWGYVDASQIHGDELWLSSSSAAATGTSSGNHDDPQHGFELTYQRELVAEPGYAWGLEAAFNFTDATIRDRGAVRGAVTRLTDAYALGGIIPPQGPPPGWAYQGTFEGPGALISDTPRRLPPVVIEDAAVTVGQRDLDASIYGFRFGPYVQVPLHSRLFTCFSGGLALAVVESDFRFAETTTVLQASAAALHGKGRHTDALPGFYLSGTLGLRLTRALDLFGGVQFQNVGIFRQSLAGKEARLDLGRSFFVTAGLGFSF